MLNIDSKETEIVDLFLYSIRYNPLNTSIYYQELLFRDIFAPQKNPDFLSSFCKDIMRLGIYLLSAQKWTPSYGSAGIGSSSTRLGFDLPSYNSLTDHRFEVRILKKYHSQIWFWRPNPSWLNVVDQSNNSSIAHS